MAVEIGFPIQNGVLVGADGYLFLYEGNHRPFDYALKTVKPSPASLANFCSNIKMRQELAERNGIPFAHIIFPDKQSVLVTQTGFDNLHSLASEYHSAAVRSGIGSCIVNPMENLAREKNNGQVFKRTDSHLTDFGSHVVIQSLLAEVSQRLPDFKVPALSFSIKSHEISGDLGSKLATKPRETIDRYWFTHRRKAYSNNIAANDGLCDIFVNPAPINDIRLLIFGDSFLRQILDALSFYFRVIMFCRSRFLHREIVWGFHPDFLLTGNVERYLDDVRPDSEAGSFLLLPWLNQVDQRPSPDFYRALDAQLSFGRYPYKRFMDGSDSRSGGKAEKVTKPVVIPASRG